MYGTEQSTKKYQAKKPCMCSVCYLRPEADTTGLHVWELDVGRLEVSAGEVTASTAQPVLFPLFTAARCRWRSLFLLLVCFLKKGQDTSYII